MKNYVKIMVSVFVSLFVSGICLAQDSGAVRAYKGADAAPVLKVQNTGAESVSIAFSGTAATNIIVAINGTIMATLDASSATYDTVAEVATGVAAVTNSAGKKVLNVDYWCSLGTDLVSNNVIIATNTIAAGNHEWADVGTWDTSALLAYPVAIAPGDSIKTLNDVDGNVLGTGNITIDVYTHRASDKVQTKVGTYQYVSPIYVASAIVAGTNANTTDSITPGVINQKVNIPAGKDGILVKASRVTTATTGGVGITAAVRK